MDKGVFKEVTLRRKEILNRVNPENVELAQSYLKYVNISNYERTTVSNKIQLLLHFYLYAVSTFIVSGFIFIFSILYLDS